MRVRAQLKQDRVIAIDYFRGVCMLIVIFSHGYPFTLPYAYLTGIGNLWTSAAELFFLMSGLTLGVVRGRLVQRDFKSTIRKCWNQAAKIYVIYLAATLLAVVISRTISSPATQNLLGNNFSGSIPSLFWSIASFQFAPGLANFLKFYVIYMLVAPFLLHAFYRRKLWWLPITLSSFALYAVNSTYPLHLIGQGSYSLFGIWQMYFVLGLVLAKFRLPIISWIYGLGDKRRKHLERSYLALAAAALAVNLVVGYTVFFGARFIKLTQDGWLPLKLEGAYLHLMSHADWFNKWFMSDRTGWFRPAATLLFFGAGYLLYQKNKSWLLVKTGKFVNTIGSDTLWVFVAQSIAIPILAAIPLRRNFVDNTLLTGVLVSLMWAVTQRKHLFFRLKAAWQGAGRLAKQGMESSLPLTSSEDQSED